MTSDPGKLLYPSLHTQWLMKDLVDRSSGDSNPFEQLERAADNTAKLLRLSFV